MTSPQSVFTGPELCRLTAAEVVTLLRKGEVTPSELIEASLARIAAVEPTVNAMPTVCGDRARAQIGGLDALRRKNGDAPGWLGGLPIAIKDLTPVGGVRTTWGTPGLKDFVPDASDPLVERLEGMGGLVMGKTNTPEMGAGGNTFNAVFGMTRNPWDTGRNAGGSSGGAAVSVATGEVWLSHGSDLAGSLRTPAAYCGVVGLRPTPGRAGGGPAAIAFSTEGVQGPMARTVLDTALFLDAMSGFDPRLPLSIEAPATPFQHAVVRATPKVRIAYAPDLKGFAPVEAEIEEVMRGALRAVEGLGATVEEACPDLTGLYDTYITLRAMAWAANAGRLPQEVQRQYKRTLSENIDLGRRLTAEQVYDAQRNRSVLFRAMQTFLEGYDVLACAVVGLKPGPVEEEYPATVAGKPVADYVDWLRFSFLATTTALPAISVPAGFTADGLPVGLQLIGPPRGEAKVLAVAKIIEDAVGLPSRLPIDPIIG
ncbi:MAG: amidase [Alphaproteobacteria bacterium]|nr:amidase [Alphaproteobacteria bacterium]MDX5367846.1 amidase [Alphaproteobacteria bacterium]MDX5462719.1 amidase [Alphaproteobacteria bacterium]